MGFAVLNPSYTPFMGRINNPGRFCLGFKFFL